MLHRDSGSQIVHLMGLQVQGNPSQAGAIECGVFAGIQAEVFCTYADGPFYITGEGHDRQVSCGGPRPWFMMQANTWFNQTDVVTLRALALAGTLQEWRTQNQSESCDVIKTWWDDVCKWMDTYVPRLQYKECNVWYAAAL